MSRHRLLSLLTCLPLAVALPAAAQTLTVPYDVQVQVDGDKAPGWLAAAGRLTGSVKVATAVDKVTLSGDRYTVESNATGLKILTAMFDNLQVVRRSEGSWMPGGQATSRFYEKRGSALPFNVALDYRTGVARFSRAPGSVPRDDKIRFLTTDTAALPYVFLGKPRPAGPVSIAFTDGRALRAAVFDPTVVFDHEVAGTKVPTVRYVARRASRSDPEIELWVRNEDGMPLRVRVGLSGQYGVRAEINPTQLPPVLRR